MGGGGRLSINGVLGGRHPVMSVRVGGGDEYELGVRRGAYSCECWGWVQSCLREVSGGGGHKFMRV